MEQPPLRDRHSTDVQRKSGQGSNGEKQTDEQKQEVTYTREDIEPLYREYRDALFRYAVLFGLDSVAAEDTVQELFVGLSRQVPFSALNIQAYLLRAIRNQAAMTHRRRRKDRRLVEEVAHMRQASGQTRVAAADYDDDLLKQAICELDDDHAHVIVLFYLESHSYKDIAEILGIPVQTVGSRLNRARRRLTDIIHRLERAQPESDSVDRTLG